MRMNDDRIRAAVEQCAWLVLNRPDEGLFHSSFIRWCNLYRGLSADDRELAQIDLIRERNISVVVTRSGVVKYYGRHDAPSTALNFEDNQSKLLGHSNALFNAINKTIDSMNSR